MLGRKVRAASTVRNSWKLHPMAATQPETERIFQMHLYFLVREMDLQFLMSATYLICLIEIFRIAVFCVDTLAICSDDALWDIM